MPVPCGSASDREKMRTLSAYVLRQQVTPALAGLAIFYFVLTMDFIVDYLNLFLAKGVPAAAVVEAFALSLAWMTLLAVPMAVMVAVLTAFGRLSEDNEITAAKSTGISVFTMMLPVLLASALIAGSLFYFSNHVLPAANQKLATLLVDIHRIKPLASIEPGVLTDLPGGYSIIVDRMDPGKSEIFGVRIHKVEAGRPPQTIVASSGYVATGEMGGSVQIELFDGEIHESEPDDPTKYHRLSFDRHVINISQRGGSLVRTERGRRGDRELSVSQLKGRLEEARSEITGAKSSVAAALESQLESVLDMAEGVTELRSRSAIEKERKGALRTAAAEVRSIESSIRQSNRLLVELHKKLAIPLACIVFVLIGAPLGIRSRRGGVGMGAGIGMLFFIVYYIFLVGGEQLGDRGIVSPFWAMWAPNLALGAVGIFLTASTCLEWRIRPFNGFLDLILRTPRTGGNARTPQ